MKKPNLKSKPLVLEHLESISRNAIKRFPEIITEFARRKSGVYALYKDNALYYVGLAKNLKSRLNGHLRDRHAEAWNRFSIYLTQGDEHLKELESLVIRIASPKGNRVAGKFIGSRDLVQVFRQRIQQRQRQELVDITGGAPPKVSIDSTLRRKRGEFDTIICPAHRDGFERVFLRKNRWYAIRISKAVIPHLKYIAIYITAPLCKITHYGQIHKVKPFMKSGKYVVLLKGKAKKIGPINGSPRINMQSTRLALMARLKRANTIADAI